MFEGKTIQETCSDLKTNSTEGLSEKEAAGRLSVYGRNALPESRKKSLIASFLEQLHDPLIYILLAASAISLLLDEISDT
ncbi:MAG: cation-transporting P-type ATPase, partial [Lachnospiraceae bacterium]|nr:cation-transporting P-type ATPase [Lachnospiraceae bacterium]